MTYYKQHLFVCTNQKAPGKTCCARSGGEPFLEYLKAQLKSRGLLGPEKIRVSRAGCLGRCDLGPCLVIYPEGLWYTYSSYTDIDEIIHHYLESGKVVTHLLINKK